MTSSQPAGISSSPKSQKSLLVHEKSMNSFFGSESINTFHGKGKGGQQVYVLEVGNEKFSWLEIYGWIDYNEKSGSILLLKSPNP